MHDRMSHARAGKQLVDRQTFLMAGNLGAGGPPGLPRLTTEEGAIDPTHEGSVRQAPTSKKQSLTGTVTLVKETGRAACRDGLPQFVKGQAQRTVEAVAAHLVPQGKAISASSDQIKRTHVILSTRQLLDDGTDGPKQIVMLKSDEPLPSLLEADPTLDEGVGQQVYNKLHRAGLKPCFTIERILGLEPKRTVTMGDVAYSLFELPHRYTITGQSTVKASAFLEKIVPHHDDPAGIRAALRAVLFNATSKEVGTMMAASTREGGLLADYLEKETVKSLQHVLTACDTVIPVLDQTEPTEARVLCFRGAPSVKGFTQLAGELKQKGILAPADQSLFLSVVRRHERYLPTFGDTDPNDLEVIWGTSERRSDSSCLIVRSRADHSKRMDVGKDMTFVSSLREIGDGTTEASLRRRSFAAIRELTDPIRRASLTTSDPNCSVCSAPLLELRIAQHEAAEGVPAEYDHVTTVRAIYKEAVEPAVQAYLRGDGPCPLLTPPNHHNFIAEIERACSALLLRPKAGRWLCGPCHSQVTKEQNIEMAAEGSLPENVLGSTSPLPSWWAMHALSVHLGIYADHVDLDEVRMTDPEGSNKTVSLWEWLPTIPIGATAASIGLATVLLATFAAGMAVGRYAGGAVAPLGTPPSIPASAPGTPVETSGEERSDDEGAPRTAVDSTRVGADPRQRLQWGPPGSLSLPASMLSDSMLAEAEGLLNPPRHGEVGASDLSPSWSRTQQTRRDQDHDGCRYCSLGSFDPTYTVLPRGGLLSSAGPLSLGRVGDLDSSSTDATVTASATVPEELVFAPGLPSETPEQRERRASWIHHYVGIGDRQRALDLGWDGNAFRLIVKDLPFQRAHPPSQCPSMRALVRSQAPEGTPAPSPPYSPPGGSPTGSSRGESPPGTPPLEDEVPPLGIDATESGVHASAGHSPSHSVSPPPAAEPSALAAALASIGAVHANLLAGAPAPNTPPKTPSSASGEKLGADELADETAMGSGTHADETLKGISTPAVYSTEDVPQVESVRKIIASDDLLGDYVHEIMQRMRESEARASAAAANEQAAEETSETLRREGAKLASEYQLQRVRAEDAARIAEQHRKEAKAQVAHMRTLQVDHDDAREQKLLAFSKVKELESSAAGLATARDEATEAHAKASEGLALAEARCTRLARAEQRAQSELEELKLTRSVMEDELQLSEDRAKRAEDRLQNVELELVATRQRSVDDHSEYEKSQGEGHLTTSRLLDKIKKLQDALEQADAQGARGKDEVAIALRRLEEAEEQVAGVNLKLEGARRRATEALDDWRGISTAMGKLESQAASLEEKDSKVMIEMLALKISMAECLQRIRAHGSDGRPDTPAPKQGLGMSVDDDWGTDYDRARRNVHSAAATRATGAKPSPPLASAAKRSPADALVLAGAQTPSPPEPPDDSAKESAKGDLADAMGKAEGGDDFDFFHDPSQPDASFICLWEGHEQSEQWRAALREFLELARHIDDGPGGGPFKATARPTMIGVLLRNELPKSLACVDNRLLLPFGASGGLGSIPLDAMPSMADPDMLQALKFRHGQTLKNRPKAVGLSRGTIASHGKDTDPKSDSEEDDAVTVASTATRESDLAEWMAMLPGDAANRARVAKLYAKSPDYSTVVKVLKSEYDPTGLNCHSRTLFKESVVQRWVQFQGTGITRDAKATMVHNYKRTEKLQALRFPKELSSVNRRTAESRWTDQFRAVMLDQFQDNLEHGVPWDDTLRYLAQATKHPDWGNKAFGTLFTRAASDPVLTKNPPLHAAVIMWKLDDNYARVIQGQTRDHLKADWNRCTHRDKSETVESLAERCEDAYLKMLNDPEVNSSNVYTFEKHLDEINHKVADCLAKDLEDLDRGANNKKVFMSQWSTLRDFFDEGDRNCQHLEDMAATRLCRLWVRRADSDWTAAVSEKSDQGSTGGTGGNRPWQSQGRNRPVTGKFHADPHAASLGRAKDGGPLASQMRSHWEHAKRIGDWERVHNIESILDRSDSPPPAGGDDVNAADQPGVGPPVVGGRFGGGSKFGGKPYGGGKNGRGSPGPGYHAAPPPYQPTGTQPLAPGRGLPMLTSPDRPQGVHPNARIPTTLPPGYTIEQLQSMRLDMDELDKWAQDPTFAASGLRNALAEWRPDAPCTGTLADMKAAAGGPPSLRFGRPQRERPDNCAYCANRPQAPPGSDELDWTHKDNWRYGTGRGNHPPSGCLCAKVFCAFGGDDAHRAKYGQSLGGNAGQYFKQLLKPAAVPRE